MFSILAALPPSAQPGIGELLAGIGELRKDVSEWSTWVGGAITLRL
jgi:hypothetical protein